MEGKCSVCYKNVLQFSYQLNCSFCSRLFHIKCLPFVSKNDSIYTNKDTDSWLCLRCSQENLPFNHINEDTEFFDALLVDLLSASQTPNAAFHSTSLKLSTFVL